MAERLDQYGCPTKPRSLGATAWFYEQRGGLIVCIETRLGETPHATISWRQLEAAIGRRRAALAKAAAP